MYPNQLTLPSPLYSAPSMHVLLLLLQHWTPYLCHPSHKSLKFVQLQSANTSCIDTTLVVLWMPHILFSLIFSGILLFVSNTAISALLCCCHFCSHSLPCSTLTIKRDSITVSLLLHTAHFYSLCLFLCWPSCCVDPAHGVRVPIITILAVDNRGITPAVYAL